MHDIYKNILNYIVLFCLIITLLNCSTMKVNRFQEPEKIIYMESDHIPGILVYFKPMLNDTETKKYFGVKLIKKNILAVHFSVWNNNPSKSFIMTQDSIKIAQMSSASEINRPEQVSQDAAKAAITVGVATVTTSAIVAAATFPALVSAGALIAFPIVQYGVPIYISKQASDASVIRENFESQRFRATTLEPGEKECGFLYFNLAELKKGDEINFCLILQDALSDEIYQPCFVVPLQSHNDG